MLKPSIHLTSRLVHPLPQHRNPAHARRAASGLGHRFHTAQQPVHVLGLDAGELADHAKELLVGVLRLEVWGEHVGVAADGHAGFACLAVEEGDEGVGDLASWEWWEGCWYGS